MLYVKVGFIDGSDIVARDMNIVETIADDTLLDCLTHDHNTIYQTKINADALYWSSNNGQDCNADTLWATHASALLGHAAGLPIGSMVFWDGIIGSIPTGWHLADGSAGTLDMRNYFPVCTSSTYAQGATRGYNSSSPTGPITVVPHTITIAEMPTHVHYYSDWYFSAGSTVRAGNTFGSLSDADYWPSQQIAVTQNTGGGGSHNHENSSWQASVISNLPPYLGLYIIERVS